MATMNTTSPAGNTTSFLIADTVNTTGAGTDSISIMTRAVNATSGLTVPVSAALEIQSTQGALLFPRLTQAQLTATSFTPIAGMQAFNSTTGVFSSYSTLQTTAAAVSASGGWAPAGFKCVSGTLTTAQIAGMYAAPVLLVPLPAAGYMHVVISFTLNADNATAAFGGGGVVLVQYSNTANGAGTAATSTINGGIFSTDAANRVAVATGAAVSQAASASFISGTATAGLYISNQTGAFTTGGGATGTATWYLNYMTVPVV